MNLTRRPKLLLELLEQRECLSLTLMLVDDSLFIRGVPTETGGNGVTLTQTANNTWHVQDAGHELGTYHADNLYVQLTNHNLTPITFNFDGNTDTGNILLNLGTGDNSGLNANGTSFQDGTLAGNLTVLGGSGRERVFLGDNGSAGVGTTGSSSMTIGGNVTMVGHAVPNLVTSSGTTDGNLLDTGVVANGFGTPGTASYPPVRIGGSLTTVAYSGVYLSPNSNVGGNVTVTALNVPLAINHAGPSFFGTVGGNVSVTGAQASREDDVFVGDGVNPATISGSVNINLGTSPVSVIDFATKATGVVIDGNTYVQDGDGPNQVTLDATFQGNVNVMLGNGNNTDTTAQSYGEGFFPANSVVYGNFTLTAGNGNNSLTTGAPNSSGNAFAGSVGGTTSIMFGNGTDSFTVASANLSGPFHWNSGNGNDSLTLAAPALGATPAYYNIYAQFGNGDDSLTLGTGVTVSGYANGGGRITGNVFNPEPGSMIQEPWTLVNFP